MKLEWAELIPGTESPAIAHWTVVDRSMPHQAANAVAALADDMGAQAKFVCDRLNGLGQRLLARFPKPDDLLSGA